MKNLNKFLLLASFCVLTSFTAAVAAASEVDGREALTMLIQSNQPVKFNDKQSVTLAQVLAKFMTLSSQYSDLYFYENDCVEVERISRRSCLLRASVKMQSYAGLINRIGVPHADERQGFHLFRLHYTVNMESKIITSQTLVSNGLFQYLLSDDQDFLKKETNEFLLDWFANARDIGKMTREESDAIRQGFAAGSK